MKSSLAKLRRASGCIGANMITLGEKTRWLPLGACLLALVVAGGAVTPLNAGVPTKTIYVYNNTAAPLYPVLETGMKPVDEWLQAAFQTTDVKKDTYSHSELYRVYLNPQNGIKPGRFVAVTVPFYSQLAQNPDPRKQDQYIDWWNGGRIYLYDEAANLTKGYNQDAAHPVTPLTEGVTCAAGKCEALDIFSGHANLPLNDPEQLAEFTFADVVTGLGAPYQLDTGRVDYDISYVDHVYLPVAMEPLDNQYIGYSGTAQDAPGFRKVLNHFLSAWQGWPTYIGDPTYPNPRIPGAYNAFIGGHELTPPGISLDQMKDLWKTCTTRNDGSDVCNKINVVNDLFQKNYQKYLTLDCQHVTLDLKLLIQHVYGWVEFNQYCKNPFANKLKDTPNVDYPTVEKTYVDLQYAPNGVFNPYVQLIHDNDYLHMNAYAFSIDDAVGNMNEIGTGLIVAVGGSDGLVNKKPFDKHNVINVNLGAPQKGFPTWKSYGICSKKPVQDLNPNFPSFAIYSVDYPCWITVSDSDGKLYQFTVLNAPPDPVIGRCKKSSTPDWCSEAAKHVKKTDAGSWVIETGPTVK